jgi:hypothetical protein
MRPEADPTAGYDKVRWRVGRTVGRTIYAQLGDVPSDLDPLIGVMDTIRLAIVACEAHNAALNAR